MFKNTFFYRTPAVAASGDGSFIFSKFRRHVFFNKIEHHSPGIFATVLKKLYSRNAFRGTHTFGGVRKIAPRSGSGFGLGLALELGLGGGEAIFLEPLLENVCQWLHVERLKTTFTF